MEHYHNVKLKSDKSGAFGGTGQEAFDGQVDFNEEEGIDEMATSN